VIAGMGSTFFRDLWQISLIFDPSLLVEGSNELRLYEVVPEGLLEVMVG
jgi:hypothetical protein